MTKRNGVSEIQKQLPIHLWIIHKLDFHRKFRILSLPLKCLLLSLRVCKTSPLSPKNGIFKKEPHYQL